MISPEEIMFRHLRTSILFLAMVALASCGGSTGSGTSTGTIDTEAAAEAARLLTLENDLLALINAERQQAGLPALERDTGLDLVMLWHVAQMANEMFLSHIDANGRGAEERVRYYSGDNGVRCSEIIQWWGGTPDADTHYQGYFNSQDHHDAYMEVGIYNLGGAEDVGIAGVEGRGPVGTQYEGSAGSYTGLVICDGGVNLAINPFDE
jgi:hypothetical protein